MKKIFFNKFSFIIILILVISNSAFSEKPAGRQNTFLSPLLEFSNFQKEKGNKKNFVNILNIGDSALLARMHLIRAAAKAIEIQTIIWVNDEAGRYVIYELIEAAKRGVKVRIIIDHFSSEQDCKVAAFLASVHPNLEVKIYNPIGSLAKKINPSTFERSVHFLTKFGKSNQRMHNKVFIVDGVIGITGGRNYQNAYYGMSKGMNYKDRDVLVTGSAVDEMTESFKAYWDYELAIPLNEMKDVQELKKKGKIDEWESRESFAFHGLFNKIDELAVDPDFIREQFVLKMMEVEHAYFVADNPGKNRKNFINRFTGKGKITYELIKLVTNAKDSIYIQSPYLVLSKEARKILKRLREEKPDIDIRISTNSLAATDSWYTYAASFRQKQVYLEDLKLRVYEFMPRPKDIVSFMPNYEELYNRPFTPEEKREFKKDQEEENLKKQKQMDGIQDDELKNIIGKTEAASDSGEPFLCLHAKSMVIDNEISYIGSYNLDPRSGNLNTEVGIVVKDRRFAELLKNSIERDILPQNSWVVAKREIPIVMDETNAIIGRISGFFPVDLWPIRFASSFQLKKGKEPVDPGHKDFYDNYDDVGSFPQVSKERYDKIFGAWFVKTFMGFATPLL
jgi:phosphatidylserine/phosphatidylglycerophosphate/cardiolipin synthase-like enzyme